VRFFKEAIQTGTHVGHLWDPASPGSPLASVTFVSETSSGWQEALFSAPVSIAANKTYVVSYFAPNGGYADNPNYFSAVGFNSGPFHVLQDGEDGGNGVFNYSPTSTFPNQTFASSNYWVDVLYTTSTSPAVNFTIAVNNNGDASATGVTLTDTLPSGSTWSFDAPPDVSCAISAGVLNCQLPDLFPHKGRVVHVGSATCGTITNTATVNSSNDSDTSDNSSTATMTVTCPTPKADVSVLKTADAASITAGQQAGFTIKVTSNGPGTATNVTLSDPLPAGFTWSQSTPGCQISSGVLSCSFGDMAAGATQTIHVTAPTQAGANCGTVLTNTATVAAGNDSDSTNNTSTASMTITCPPPAPCTASGSNRSNFNGTVIPAGDTIWFSGVVKVSGLPSSGSGTIGLTGGTIQFSANGTDYNLATPNGRIVFVPGTTTATTTFDTATNTWVTTMPPHFSGNAFLAGFALTVPAGGLPGGINPVTWSATFTSDTPGVGINFQWAAAVYTSFSTNYNALGVKATDDNHLTSNSDAAGAPENFKPLVVGGARGGGGGNVTGSLSGTLSITPVCH
jgi:uncharacterized repeat protein (TIGR01451 family)